MDHSLSSDQVADDAEPLDLVIVLVPKGRSPSEKPGHQLDQGKGPYWCPETHRFYREVRVLSPHLLCAGCPSTVGGTRKGVLGRVVGVESP